MEHRIQFAHVRAEVAAVAELWLELGFGVTSASKMSPSHITMTDSLFLLFEFFSALCLYWEFSDVSSSGTSMFFCSEVLLLRPPEG